MVVAAVLALLLRVSHSHYLYSGVHVANCVVAVTSDAIVLLLMLLPPLPLLPLCCYSNDN